jgi:hypothetical protein
MSGNGSNVNLKRHFLLKLVKSLWVNLFPASFSHLESLATAVAATIAAAVVATIVVTAAAAQRFQITKTRHKLK